MNADDVERLIESEIHDADATVTRPRAAAEEDEDAHFAATVVAPAFEGETLVDRHEMVYDAVGEHMTTDVHALEITTYTPAEADEAAGGDDDPSGSGAAG